MAEAARVIVIGGGITGTTIAATLAEAGHQVTLLEKETVGGNGATRFSGALFRLYDPDREIAKLAHASVQLMAHTRVGDVFAQSLQRSGILYASEKNQHGYDSVTACIKRYSNDLYPMELVSAQRAYELSCGCYSAENQRTILHEPKGGFGDIRKAARDMAFMVRSAGGSIMEHTRVEGLHADANGVSVRCGAVQIEADYAVLAAGAWSGTLCDFLPIETQSIPLVSLEATRQIPLPIIDTKTGTHLIPLNRGFYQAGSKIRIAAKLPEALDYDNQPVVPDVLARLRGSLIEHDDNDVAAVIKGYDSYTADGRPLLDFIDEHQRCMVATGFCGIGYKIALAVARNVCDRLLDETGHSDSDSRLYALERFAASELVS